MTYDPSGQQPYDPYGQQPGYHPDSSGYSDPYGQPGYNQQHGYGQQSGYGYEQPAYTNPGQYSTPGYGQFQPPGPQPQNGFGIAGMVLGIVSLVFSVCCGFFGAVPLGTAAIVFGGLGLGKANKGEATNKGMALSGIICGGISYAIAIVLLILQVIFGVWETNYTYYP